MFRLNSQGGNEVFGYKNTFALRNGSLGWFQGVEEQFSLTHEMSKFPSYRKQLNWGWGKETMDGVVLSTPSILNLNFQHVLLTRWYPHVNSFFFQDLRP